ncbi:MAG: hypothetical protein ACI8R4_004100 [Paracoccaceae bacterium]|jgi:hypothetical protein
MDIQFCGLPSADVIRIRTDMRDAYDLPVETHLAVDDAYPCRHCLKDTPKGQTYLILAHRPFVGVNSYTETGPIFVCADDCTAAVHSPDIPAILQSPQYIVRGYTAEERILYGTGQVTPTAQIPAYAASLLANPEIAFVDVRSAANNCFQCRVRRVS